ncbi:hypothetical protein BDQ12DRAFT_229473 [Crucibulum laeve]|uniref:Uncharacterized protein n=1 Tax=Crucibulum laeve TaxID=68775 RepID=A0A5C3LVQ9_9AGAR|nr:hypothetical protein BDQ12DRAFT_229473 [Crucibulum laeve]
MSQEDSGRVPYSNPASSSNNSVPGASSLPTAYPHPSLDTHANEMSSDQPSARTDMTMLQSPISRNRQSSSTAEKPAMHPRLSKGDTEWEFDPYDPANFDGPKNSRRIPALQGSRDSGIHRASSQTGNVTPRNEVHGPGSRLGTGPIIQVERLGDDQMLKSGESEPVVHVPAPVIQITQNRPVQSASNVLPASLLSPPSNDVQTVGHQQRPRPERERDARSIQQSISTNSGSSNRSRLPGKPQPHYLPKKLVMPTPLQQSNIPLTANQPQIQAAHLSGQKVRFQPSPFPTHITPSMGVSAILNRPAAHKPQDIPIASNGKLRKRTSTMSGAPLSKEKVTPTVAAVFSAGYMKPPPADMAPAMPVRSKTEKIPKRVLSKRRTDF